MNAKINPHVISNQDNAASAKLYCEIERVKPAVPAPPYLAEAVKQ